MVLGGWLVGLFYNKATLVKLFNAAISSFYKQIYNFKWQMITICKQL